MSWPFEESLHLPFSCNLNYQQPQLLLVIIAANVNQVVVVILPSLLCRINHTQVAQGLVLISLNCV